MRLSVTMTRKEVLLGYLFLTLQLLILPWMLIFLNSLLPKPLSACYLNFTLFALEFMLSIAIFHRFLYLSALHSARKPLRCLICAAIGTVGYYLVSMLIGWLIGLLYPSFFNLNDLTILQLAQDDYPIMIIGTVFLVPLAEETLYRGLIFSHLHSRSRIGAYALSSLLFGLIHITGYVGYASIEVLALCLLQYLPAGLMLAWVYEKADSIWAPILMHMAINQISMINMR